MEEVLAKCNLKELPYDGVYEGSFAVDDQPRRRRRLETALTQASYGTESRSHVICSGLGRQGKAEQGQLSNGESERKRKITSKGGERVANGCNSKIVKGAQAIPSHLQECSNNDQQLLRLGGSLMGPCEAPSVRRNQRITPARSRGRGVCDGVDACRCMGVVWIQERDT